MDLKVIRIAKRDTYTIGKLYIDGEYFCDTCEDRDRQLDSSMSIEEIREIKVYGETAIPTGTYRVAITYSMKFRKMLPELIGVKGFSGIRIHSGNTSKDSLGCILVGKNTRKGQVTSSRATFDRLMLKLNKTTDPIFITIE